MIILLPCSANQSLLIYSADAAEFCRQAIVQYLTFYSLCDILFT